MRRFQALPETKNPFVLPFLLTAEEKERILLGFFRYSLGRETHVVPMAVDFLTANLSLLRVKTMMEIVHEIQENGAKLGRNASLWNEFSRFILQKIPGHDFRDSPLVGKEYSDIVFTCNVRNAYQKGNTDVRDLKKILFKNRTRMYDRDVLVSERDLREEIRHGRGRTFYDSISRDWNEWVEIHASFQKEAQRRGLRLW